MQHRYTQKAVTQRVEAITEGNQTIAEFVWKAKYMIYMQFVFC